VEVEDQKEEGIGEEDGVLSTDEREVLDLRKKGDLEE
jgi:hypothetical protein